MEWTGGGMASTTSDLARWAKYYYEGDLFSKKMLAQVTSINSNGNKVMGNNSYGMGSFIYHLKQGDAYGHSGFMPGYNSIFAYFPKEKIAVALQSNCDYAGNNMPLEKYVEELMSLVVQIKNED
jgi:D-alanyl-D-alanine carboxypeptidase